ncbi:MAG: holin [Oscillibacter sp.]|nr:holin [Oscillibacter sp.]
MRMQDLTPIFEALTALAAAVLTAAVIPWVRARLGAERMAELLDWVRIGVAAAEQLYRGGNGSEKKQYVLRFLEERGYAADSGAIDRAIEAAVLELHHTLYGEGSDGNG